MLSFDLIKLRGPTTGILENLIIVVEELGEKECSVQMYDCKKVCMMSEKMVQDVCWPCTDQETRKNKPGHTGLVTKYLQN